MKPGAFALLVVLNLGLRCALVADAQPAKVSGIGVLGPRAFEPGYDYTHLFLEPLREIGYVEGKNIRAYWRFAFGRLEQLPDLAAELVRLKVDVILAPGTLAALAARNATRTIPIVMVGVGDPVALGLVSSLARPGGNITGLSLSSAELSAKRLQLIRDVVRRDHRVAVLVDPADPIAPLAFKETEVAARSLGLALQPLEVSGPKDLDDAFSAIVRERVRAVVVLPSDMFFESRERIVALAAQYRLPAIAEGRGFAESGGLMAYGANVPDLYRRAAVYLDKILKGARPADLPVEQPTRFELVINLKTAKALGLTIPQSILLRADHVIQ